MTPKEILSACLSRDKNSRYKMDAFFKQGEYVYATNGEIAARVPCDVMPEVGEVEKTPGCKGIFPDGGICFPLPESRDQVCSACDGGMADEYIACPHCGEDVPTGHKIACGICHGTNKGGDPVSIGSALISPGYLEMLKRFGVTHVHVTGNKSPVRWSVGKVDGVLATMDPPQKPE